MAPALITVVNKANTTGKRVNTCSSCLTSGFWLLWPSGKAFHRENMVSKPSREIPRKAIRQPICCPIQVASGTPPILAMVRPINIMATALACLSFGTTLAATTEPIPKKAPWFRLVMMRAPINPR